MTIDTTDLVLATEEHNGEFERFMRRYSRSGYRGGKFYTTLRDSDGVLQVLLSWQDVNTPDIFCTRDSQHLKSEDNINPIFLHNRHPKKDIK